MAWPDAALPPNGCVTQGDAAQAAKVVATAGAT